MKNSFVYRAFRSEFEVDSAFTANGLKYLKKRKETKPEDSDQDKTSKKLPFESIPGYSHLSSFHKKSELDRQEMSDCFDLFKLMKSGTMTKADLEKYDKYKEKIIEEQGQYLELAKSVWQRENFKRHKEIKPEVEECMNFVWKGRLERIEKYPKYYTQVGLYSLMHPNAKDVEMKFTKFLRTVGRPVSIFFPKLQMFKANLHSVLNEVIRQEQFKRLSVPQQDSRLIHTRYYPEISMDKIAEDLALENSVDFVLAESSFLNLLDNHYPKFDKTWDLPVTIKELTRGNGVKKKVIFIDKALPPRSINTSDKNRWYCKLSCDLILRRKCSELRNPEKSITEEATNDFKSNTSCDYCKNRKKKHITEFNEYEESCEPEETNFERESLTKDEDAFDSSSDESVENKLMIVEDESRDNVDNKVSKEIGKLNSIGSSPTDTKLCADKCTCKKSSTEKTEKEEIKKSRNQITYSLWSLGKHEHSVMSKTNSKHFNVIIRYKEGFINKFQEKKKYKISSKVEYQTEFGGEVLTLSEVIREWGRAYIRPGTDITEVRVNPLNGDIIMFESRTIHDLVQDCLRLYNVKPSNCLNTIYSVIEKLATHEPGKYHLCHQPRNEAFVPFFKETEGPYIFGLHSSYRLSATEIAPEKSAWIPIDVNVLTPTFRYFHRVPAMLPPRGFRKKVVVKPEPVVKKRKLKKPGKKPRKRKNKKKQ